MGFGRKNEGFDDDRKRYSRYQQSEEFVKESEKSARRTAGRDARYTRDDYGYRADRNERGAEIDQRSARGYDEPQRGRRNDTRRSSNARYDYRYDDRQSSGRGAAYDRASGRLRGNGDRQYDQRRSNENRRYDAQDRYRYEDGSFRPKKRRKWPIVLLVFLLLIVGAGAFLMGKLGQIDREKLDNLLVNTGLISESGYRNIVLYGVDSRQGNLTKDCLSDTIMIVSINKRTKEVKLASVYRDSYLDNLDGHYRKATECYMVGGPSQSINMLNANLDLDISDYVTVNFNSMIDIVDALGGIDLEITEEEMRYINGYCVENKEVTGVDYTDLTSYGQVHLTGIQALAYCRIRYTEGWDYKRTERQRTVLNLVAQKAKSTGVTSLLSIANSLLPEISTSMSTTDILGLIASAASYSIGDQTGFPFEKYPMDVDGSDVVVPQNLAQNVTELHYFLFGEEGYTPTETVRNISDTIAAKTGVY